MLRRCSACKLEKDLTCYYKAKNGKFGLKSECKSCCYVRNKTLRLNNPSKHRENSKRGMKIQREKFKALLYTIKDNSCLDCGVKYKPWMMQFDHRYDKKFNITSGAFHTINDVENELKKCDLVCANCHKSRTKHRKKGIRNSPGSIVTKVQNFKDNKECFDCKIKFPYYVLEFDHLNGKNFNIATIRGKTEHEIFLEINNCELVCANCHHNRTYLRKQNYV